MASRRFLVVAAVYHRDSRGHTVAITDSAGQPQHAQYNPYGMRQTYNAWGTLQPLDPLVYPFLYGGRDGVMTDPNELIYMRNRYYHPSMRRFLNPDPLGEEGGYNLYLYANANPVVFGDPLGLCAHERGLLGMLGSLLNVFARDIGAAALGIIAKPLVLGSDLSGLVLSPLLEGDVVGALSGIGKSVYDLAIPSYGFYGGANWGVEQFGNDGIPQPLNRVDNAAFIHDSQLAGYGTEAQTKGEIDRGFVRNAFIGDGVAPGPIGVVYSVLGAITVLPASYTPLREDVVNPLP